MKIHVDDFTIEEAYLDYYRLPSKIDIEGYIHPDHSESIELNPIESDKIINEIISFCVLETIRTYEKSDEFALARDRVNNEI